MNLRTQLMKIIRRAGLEPWPKLWQNLRSTRETERADHFPAHVISAWIGNSEQVAARHYLQVRIGDGRAVDVALHETAPRRPTAPTSSSTASTPTTGPGVWSPARWEKT